MNEKLKEHLEAISLEIVDAQACNHSENKEMDAIVLDIELGSHLFEEAILVYKRIAAGCKTPESSMEVWEKSLKAIRKTIDNHEKNTRFDFKGY